MAGLPGDTTIMPQALFFKGPFFSLPIALDTERAKGKIQDLRTECDGLDDRPMADDLLATLAEPGVDELLQAIFSNSPFLTRCALSDPLFLKTILEQGPDTGLCQVIDEVKDELSRVYDDQRIRRGLRVARNRVALLVALADITGTWSLERVTEALSDFADVAVSAALSHLLIAAAEKGDLVLKDEYFPEFECGYFALAMGKYGARELNYSSDIDLIVIYDPVKIDYRGNRSVQQFLIRMTRDLVSLLQEPTGDGYVFRVDLRLRPDPGSTPVAIPYANALTYYETRAEGWERAAMIKARPAIGDLTLGRRFMAELSSFVWRPNVDFWAQREMAKIKRQINEHRGSVRIDFHGHNIKLGRGGIREIEFFAQSHQLVYGGRDPYLRSTRTLDALSSLTEAGHISDQTADVLTEAYEFLRQLEHRLQMINDQQTQTLPADDEGMKHIAAFMGYNDVDGFRDVLLEYLRIVEQKYTDVFEDDNDNQDEQHVRALAIENREEAIIGLADLGFAVSDSVYNAINRWKSRTYGSIRDPRCQELLTDLTPRVIETAMKSDEPDNVVKDFDDFLRQLKSGVQLLSTISSNQKAFDFLFESLATAPALVHELSRWPDRLQCVLATGAYDEIPDVRILMADCRQSIDGAGGVAAIFESIAAWSNDERFRTTAQFCDHAIDCTVIGHALANIADTVVQNIYACPELQPEGLEPASMAPLLAVALGSYGSRELTSAQPADLVFICQDDPQAETSITQTARRILLGLSSPSANGRILATNFGATPYGTDSPIITQIRPFLSFCDAHADPSAILALTQARIVAGDDALAADTQQTLNKFILDGQAWAALSPRLEDLSLRFRTDDQSGSWNVRYGFGGLEQLEALIALLQVRHASQHPDVLTFAHGPALAELIVSRELDPELGKQLIEAQHLMHQIESFLAATTDGRLNPDTASSRFKAALARSCGVDGLAHVEEMLGRARTRVAATFEDVIAQNN
jgi:glutamate-ammonia-ligase adenylyltransferase